MIKYLLTASLTVSNSGKVACSGDSAAGVRIDGGVLTLRDRHDVFVYTLEQRRVRTYQGSSANNLT